MNHINFAAMGHPRLSCAEGGQIGLKSTKALALLGYLLRRRDYKAPRSTIISFLWSGAGSEKGAISLRQCLRLIRRAQEKAGVVILHASITELWIDPDNLRLEFGGSSQPADGQAQFLEGLDNLDPVFADWLMQERRVLAGEKEKAAKSDPAPSQIVPNDQIGRPAILISAQEDAGHWAISAKDAVMVQLARYRYFELFVHNDSPAVKLTHRDIGDYQLSFRTDEPTQRLYVELIEHQTGRVLYLDFIDTAKFSDASQRDELISRTVNRINLYIIHMRDRQKPADKTPFDIWCKADSYLREFRPEADHAAQNLLEPMAKDGIPFGPIYSSLASIDLKKRIYHKDNSGNNDLLMKSLRLAKKSVLIDPFEAFNHQILGWSLFFNGHISDGLKHFDEAYDLNPSSVFAHMAVAEANGLAGNIEKALRFCEMAFRSADEPPRFFYGYLANIQFAAQDYDACIESCAMAPHSSLEAQTLAVAANVKVGQLERAFDCFARLAALAGGSSRQELENWLRRTVIYTAPQPRQAYIDSYAALSIDISPE